MYNDSDNPIKDFSSDTILVPGRNDRYELTRRLRVQYITFFVRNLQRSYLFYRNALGLHSNGIKTGPDPYTRFSLGNGLSLVLVEKDNASANSNDQLRSLPGRLKLTHFADSKAEVNLICQKALVAGAVPVGEPREEPWCYAVTFADPDGLEWEIAWEA